MTSKEILENSKRIISIKKDIDSGDKTAPDLEDQVREMFYDDCANRAKFVDSSLIISASAREFRNVFGIDAPNFKITQDCKMMYDRNEDGKFDSNTEAIEIQDPMKDRTSDSSTEFIDSWDLINAARFDCPFPVSNFQDDPSKLPVDKQGFFVDSKKDEESSTFHSPLCPPGLNRWAGNKVYKNICNSFDLDEITVYKLFSDISNNTIPKGFTIECDSTTNPLECNINSNGEFVRNIFNYNLKKDSDGSTKDTETRLREFIKGGGCIVPRELLDTENPMLTESPTKWYTTTIPVSSEHVNAFYVKQYNYTYNFNGTPFQNTVTPIVSFRLKADREFNSGYAMLIPDASQLNELPTSGDKPISSIKLRYSFNVLYLEDEEEGIVFDNTGAGGVYGLLVNLGFIKAEKYLAIFSPITSISEDAKKKIAGFILNLISSCLEYKSMIEERKINNIIPDYDNSIHTMEELYRTVNRFRNKGYHDDVDWDDVMNRLRDRVYYDIIGKVNPTLEEIANIRKHSEIYDIDMQYVEDKAQYIYDYYNIAMVIKDMQPEDATFTGMVLPIDENIYTSSNKIIINSTKLIKDFKYSTVKKNLIKSDYYLHPTNDGNIQFTSGGYRGEYGTFDEIIPDNSITLYKLVYEVLSNEEKLKLITTGRLKGRYYTTASAQGTVLSGEKYTKIKIGDTWFDIDSSENAPKFNVVYNYYEETRPSYNQIQRATDLNWFMKNNPELFVNAFNTITSRIDKRTGTLRKTLNLLDAANINIQMLEQRKKELKNLFRYMNAFEITGGFGTNELTIQLTAWEGEDLSSIYSVLERMGSVYVLTDNTRLKKYSGKDLPNVIKIDSAIRFAVNQIEIHFFDPNTCIKTAIKEIIEQASESEYEYNVSKDDAIKKEKTYYIINDLGKYELAKKDELTNDNLINGILYERGTAISGPTFKVTLQTKVPESYAGKNARLVKVF